MLRISRKLAVTLIAITSSQSLGETWGIGDSVPTAPALPTRMSSRLKRSKIAAPSWSICAPFPRSSGTRVARSPPAWRIWSSTSSSPPTVRAARISRAPSAANRRATAAPIPREAPVIRATRPASRPELASAILCKQAQLDGNALVVVGEGDRIIAGEAGIAEARPRRIAPGLAHRAVEPVDGDEGEAVDAED